MAKSDAGFATSRPQKYQTTWLRNAMKSIGISANEAIKEISPNLHEVAKSGVDASKTLFSTVNRSRRSTERIGDVLQKNKYFQYANKAYKNALADLKSGNLNNKDRESEALMGSFGDVSEFADGMSFGDDGAENVEVNVINQESNSEGFATLATQMAKNTASQIKMQKASIDASIAIGGATLNQIGQLGVQINTLLGNVNSNLSALVQYNNENMSKFIEASMAYYEKSGGDKKSGYEDKGKISAGELLNSSNGGINLAQYKNYVKQQFKDAMDKSDVGLIKSMLDDPMVLEMAASNPLGFATTALSRYMIPKVLRTSLESVETTFSNFMPTLLTQIGDLARTEGNSFMDRIKRVIGKTFGISFDRTNTFEKATIERGAIPFDGETKHAITEIITKELRQQTGYLEIIASHYNRNAKSQMLDNQEFWSYKNNGYVGKNQIDMDIANEIVNSITSAFSDNAFGKAMMGVKDRVKNNDRNKAAHQAELENTVKELFVSIERHQGSVDLPTMITLIDQLGANSSVKKTLIDHVVQMQTQNADTFQSVNTGKIRAYNASEDAKKRISSDPYAYQLTNSSFNERNEKGEIVQIDDVIDRLMNWHGEAKNRQGIKSGKRNLAEANFASSNINANPLFMWDSSDIKGSIKTNLKGVSDTAVGMMQSIMQGDTQGVIEKGATFIGDTAKKIGTKLSSFFLGEKDQEGKYNNGIISGILNDTKENFSKIGDSVKNGIMLKIFGRVKNEETGQYEVDEESKGGLFGSFSRVFHSGLDGWTDALFGTNSEDERKGTQEKVVNYLKEAAPAGITGAALGAGVSVMTGGSLLGMVIGGPLAGAGLGAAIGFLSKNEKFQNYLFGEKDEDGNRMGGLISKKTQDFFKDNKDFAIGSAAVGGISGMITGGGLLGTLVGGPIAGALMGLAGGVVMKSGIFQRFLFGDEEKGQKGLISGVKDAWSKHFPKGEEDVSAAGIKAIGMTGMGTAAGGLIGTLIGGPVVGALAGFALSVKAQGGNFKEWLFGKEDGLSIGDGKKVKKQGVIGVIGNAINANIIKPMKTQFSYMAEDAMNVLEHKVLAPFAFAAEFVADKLGGITQKITSGASSLFNKVTHSITSTIGKLFSPITEAVGNTMQKATDFVYNGFKKVVSAPGALISAVIKTFDLKEKFKNLGAVKFVRGLFADARNLIFKGIQGVFKGIFNVITAPFKGIGHLAGLIGKGARSLGSKIAGIQIDNKTIGERFKDRFGSGRFKRLYDNFKEELDSRGVQFGSLTERMKLNKLDYQKREAEIKENRKNNERHDKNAKIIQRYTKGQFSEDTDDARNWLKYHKPDIYSKYFGEGSTSGKSVTAEIEESRNGASINGMSDDAVLSANPDTLNPESRQTQAILKVGNTVLGIYKILNGENPTDEELAEKAAEEKENQKHDRQELKGASKEDLINELHNAGVDDFDSNISEEELRSMARRQRQIDRGIIPNAPTVGEQRKWSLSAFKERVSNYFKNDFMSNTRNLFRKKDEAEEAVDEATAETGENVQKHSLGGILKKGLSLIGEKGAELLRLGDDGEAEVLSSDDTKKAAKEAKNKKKKLSDFFKKKKESDEGFDFGNALEEQDDEGIINRIKHAAYIRNNTTNIEEYRKAMAEGQAALNARFEDMRQDSLDKAKRNAKSADQLKAEMEAQKEKDEQKRYRADMLKATLAGSEATNKFKDLWSSIFSKKGLLTGALLLGYAWLKKNAPEILSMLGGILSGIGTFATSALGDAAKQFLNTEKNATRTDGNTMGEQLEKNIEDIKNGDILTDAEGNATHQSESRAKFLLRTGMNFLNRNHKTPGFGPFFGKNAKIANAEKGVFRFGEKVVNGAKNLGAKLFGKSDWEKTTGKLVGNTSVNFLDDGARAMTKSSWDTFAKQLASEGIDPQLYAAQEGIKVLDDTEGLGRRLITKVKGSKAGQAVSGFVDDVAKKGATFADNIAQGVKGSAIGKAASSAKNAISTGVVKVGEKIADKAAANDGLLSKVAGYIDEFFKFITSKFGQKTGTEVGTSIFKSVSPSKIVSALTKKWSTICEKISAKITSVTGVKASAAAVSFGLSESIFATIGALNGVSGTAKLFRVPADKVDGNMRLIAGIFGALTGTTLGSIIDIILSFAGDIMGVDILSSMAVGLYNVMVGKDSEKAKALEDAQSAFMDSYLEDRDSKLQEQYETQKKAGIIGPDVTYDMFAEGVKDGTYSASYKSFDDYNTEKNASIGDKVISGLGKAVKGTGNLLGKAGKAIFGGTDSYTDANGNVYTKNTDGTYQVKSSSGEDLGYVSADVIDLNSMQKNTSKGLVGNIVDGAKNLGSKAVGFVKDVAGGAKDLLANGFDKLKNIGKTVGPPTMDYIKGTSDSIDFGCPEDNPGKPIITAIEKAMQFLTFGPHAIVKIGKTIGTFIGDVINGAKILLPRMGSEAKDYVLGNKDNISLTDSTGISPLSVAGKVMEFGLALPRGVVSIGKKIGDFIGNTINSAKQILPTVWDQSKSYLLGETDSVTLSEDPGLTPLNVVGKVLQFGLMLPRGIVSTGRAIGEFIGNTIQAGKELIPKIGEEASSYVTGETDAITLSEDPGLTPLNVVGKVLQFGLMLPRGIITTAKSVGSFIGSAVDGFKELGPKTLESAKAFVTGDADSINLALDDGNLFKPVGDIISKVLQGILIPVRFIGKIVGGIADTVGGVVDGVKDFGSGIVEGAKNVGSTVVNGVKGTASAVGDAVSGAFNFLTGGGGLGGRGEETLNGAAYFSQNDNRWANNSYSMGGDNATMSDTGCGPTAMAMAINTARGGGNVTPTQMAGVAQMTGMRDETGTNANFISQSANMVGLNSEERFMPSSYDLNQQLDSGNPVVLLGRTGGNGDVPYTDAGHYVVAVGRDPSGNILVNDPRGRSYSGAYNPEELANSTEASWSIGNGGYGRKQNRIRRRRGGFGPEMTTVAAMDGGGSTSSQTGIKDWLSVVAAVKKAIGVQQKGYSQSGYIDFTVDGKTYNTRRDCSGFVSACLNVYTGEKHLTSSRGFASDANIASWLTKYGFSKMNWSGWENTKAGDILVIPGHVEISAQDGVKKVYNCGSDSSCNNPGITDGSKSAYTYIWRPNNAGTGGQILTTNAGVVGSYDSGSFASASPTGGTQETGIGALTSYIGNFFGEFGKRAISGDFSNTDYSSLLSNDSSSSGYSGYSAGSPSGEYVGIVGGGTTEENAKVLAKVLAKNGFNANQIGGILSNFNQESGIDTTSVETIFDEKFKIGSRKQSAMSDFTTFTLNKVFPAYEGRLNINKNAYRGSGSSYWPGIGLGQWTGPRAEALVNYARANNKNWYDPDLQVNYMINQDSFKGRLEKYKNTTAGYSPREAAKYFENKWEGSTHNEAGHQATADAWAAKVPELIGGAGEGKHRIRKTTGGRGAKPDYRRLRHLGGKSGALSIDNNMIGTSTNGNTSYVSNYIRTTKDTSIQELFVNAIEILAAIAGNTKEASTKLEALKSLSNISANTSTSNNNIIVNGDRSTNSQHKTGQQVNYGGRGSTEADRIARGIAMGGY